MPYSTSATKQLGKGQDFAVHGSNDTYSWQVICDGHGTDVVIDLLRSFNWDLIMRQSNSFNALLTLLRFRDVNTLGSGSTLVMTKIFAHKVETLSVGNSKVFIYKKGELAYTNSIHLLDNPVEEKRLAKRKNIHIQMLNRSALYIIGSNKMRGKRDQYYIFENGEKLAMTQALGHAEITGLEPEMHTEYYSEGDAVRVVACSNGFADMCLFDKDACICLEDKTDDKHDILHMTVDELMGKVERRFKQEWYIYSVDKYPELFKASVLKTYADISLAIWDNRMPV